MKKEKQHIPYCPKCDKTKIHANYDLYCHICGTKLKFPKRYIFCKCGKDLIDIVDFYGLFVPRPPSTTEYFCTTCGKGYIEKDLIEKHLEKVIK